VAQAPFDEHRIHGLFPGTSLLGNYYRMLDRRFSGKMDEISPSLLYGGRYNPAGEFGVLYLAVSPRCAYAELLKQVEGVKEDLPALVVGAFRLDLRKCLDLTDTHVQKSLGIDLVDLTLPADFQLTHQISQAARKIGFEAVLVPSAANPECKNLVVYKDKLLPPSFCIFDVGSVQPYGK
jgi:RES domain-containing protein